MDRVKDHGLGGQGPKPQKRGGPGGSQKSPNFAHGGGKFGGGVFGGVPKNRGHKTWSFMKAINIRFNLIVEDDHHR